MSLVPQEVVELGAAQLRERGELDESRWEKFSDSERFGHSFARGRDEGLERGLEQGLERGLEQGRAEVLRRVVIDVLELRGATLTPAQIERITACDSLETLERWYAAARASAPDQPIDQLLGQK